jgi:hypothetical protein
VSNIPNLHPDLAPAIDAAYQRHKIHPHSQPEIINDQTLGTLTEALDYLSPKAINWARSELDNNFDDGALGAWDHCAKLLTQDVPQNLSELLTEAPELAYKIEELYNAKQKLEKSGIFTEDKRNVADSMKLVMFPWKTFYDKLPEIDNWLWQVRQEQDLSSTGLLNDIFNYIKDPNANIYKKPDKKAYPTEWISTKEYLRIKLLEDGDWGLGLVQTSPLGGIDYKLLPTSKSSVDDLTDHGTKPYLLAGRRVDDLGVLEWLSLTMQYPSNGRSYGVSTLMGNRLEPPATYPEAPTFVILAGWDSTNTKYYSGLVQSDRSPTIPRLAVL